MPTSTELEETTAAAASAPAGPTGRLVRWAHDLTWDDVPEAVRSRSRHLLLDTIGCALVGAQLPWSRVATGAVLGIEGPGNAAVIGTGRASTPVGAALLNSCFIQGFELDDFHPYAPLHSGSLVLPALLSTGAATTRPVSGRDFLLAAVIGFEVGPRIGRALGGTEMLARGWHSGPVFGGIAAALTAGRIRGLNQAQLEDAVGFAATQSGGLMSAQYEAMGKRMQHGFAARNGFYSAALAEAGYTGIDQVLERPYGGFLAVFGEGHSPDVDAVTRGLGTDWETSNIMIKSFAVMGGLHGAVEAAQHLRAKLGTDVARRVERIDIRVGDVIYHHGWWTPERPLTAIGGQMNIGYVTAVTLCDGTALPEQFGETRLNADDVWRLLDRTYVEHDASIDALPAAERSQTNVTVTLDDGSTFTESVIEPHGTPQDPVTNEEIIDKFRALTSRVIDPDRARAIENTVLALDDAQDVAPLVELLAPTTDQVLR